MIKNKNLPYYLYSNIILLIINYLLIDIKYNNNNNKYSIKKFNHNINEIIKLSIVDKNWFNIVSNIIKNNLINNDNLHNWIVKKDNEEYSILYEKQKIKGIPLPIIIQTIKINQSLSLIKISNEEIIKYFKNHENNKTIQLLLNSEINNSNVIQFNNENLIDLGSSGGDGGDNIDKLEIYDNGMGLIQESTFSNNIIKLNPKQLIIYPYSSQSELYHMNYKWIFQIPNIQVIKIDGMFQHIEPSDFETLESESSKLYYLSIGFLFHQMIKILRKDDLAYNECNSGQSEFLISNTPELISNDLNILFERLSNNSTIRICKIKNTCDLDYGKCLKQKFKYCKKHLLNENNPNYCKLGNGIDCLKQRKLKYEKQNQRAFKFLNDKFNFLFSNNNNNSKIEYLKLVNLDFLNEYSFNGLINNNSIKTLILRNNSWPNLEFNFKSNETNEFKSIDYLISNVLTINKSIINLEIVTTQFLNNVFKLLLKFKSNLNLFSIKITFQLLNLNDIIEFISSTTTTTIQEIHLIYYNNKYGIKKSEIIEEFEMLKNKIIHSKNCSIILKFSIYKTIV